MIKLKPLLFLLALLFGTHLIAQDIHYTMFNMSPLTLNPAYTGAFEGTARVGGIYRDQWTSIFGKNKYKTPSFYVDAPVVNGFRKLDWIGVGLTFYQDQAGLAGLKTNAIMLSGAYHLAVDKKGRTVLTLGAQGGWKDHSVTDLIALGDALILEDESPLGGNLNGFSDDRLPAVNGKDPSTQYFDINAGLLLTSKVGDNSILKVGVSGQHLNRPQYNLLGGGATDANKLPIRINGHAGLRSDIGTNWLVEPTLAYQTIGSASQFSIQAWGGRYLKPEKDIALKLGLGYRGAYDAGQIMLGLDYKNLQAAIGYDVNISSLSDASGFRGGFEIAANYIFRVFKDPIVKPVIFCPQL